MVLAEEALERKAEIYYIRVTAENGVGRGVSAQVDQHFHMSVTELMVNQIGQEIEISWRHSVLDRPLLKFIVTVSSKDARMDETFEYSAFEAKCTRHGCNEGAYLSTEALVLPDGPMSMACTVSVLVMLSLIHI